MPSGSDTTADAAVVRARPRPPGRHGAAAGAPRRAPGATAAARRGRGRAAGDVRPVRRLARALARREARRGASRPSAGLALGARLPAVRRVAAVPAAVAALTLLTRGRTARQGAWLGFAFGLPFFLWLLKWLHVVGWDAVVGLSVIEALFLAALGAGLALTSRLPLWPLWGACLWVAEELARDRLPFGGFPWGRLAFANTGSPVHPARRARRRPAGHLRRRAVRRGCSPRPRSRLGAAARRRGRRAPPPRRRPARAPARSRARAPP